MSHRQITMGEITPEYQAFTDKFKPKLTTDDCYTPDNIYEVVRSWVFEHYGLLADTPVVRPFWPGGDYQAEDKLRSKRSITLSKRFSEFMDADGFTATYRKGNWYYQHYQTKEQVQDLAKQNGFAIDAMAWGKHGDSYQTAMHKTMQLSDDDLIAALSFEFDLPLPSGRSYGRQSDIIAACRRAGLLHSDGQIANCGTCRTP